MTGRPPAVSTLARALDEAAIVAVTDRRGRITHCNEKFCQISGYEASELVGQTHRIINSGHHPKSFFAEMYGTISRGEVWSGTICNRTKTGDLYWVDTTIVPEMSADGTPKSYTAVRFEVTDQSCSGSIIPSGNIPRCTDYLPPGAALDAAAKLF